MKPSANVATYMHLVFFIKILIIANDDKFSDYT